MSNSNEVLDDKKYNKLIVILSIVIPIAVAVLFGVKIPNVEPLSFLPPIYATINGLTAVILVVAFFAIKNKNIVLHENLMTGNKEAIYKLSNEGFNLYSAQAENVAGGFEHSGNFALIDKNGYIRSRKDQYGNPIIYYRGIASEEEQVDDNGETEQISALKEDIKKLLHE